MLRSTSEAGPPITAADLARVERRFGVQFPEDYRAFLLRYNGGRPSPAGFLLPGPGGSEYARVHFFFGIDDPVESINLEWKFNLLREIVPVGAIPIANDEGGWIFCLRTLGPRRGEVLLWTHAMSQRGDRTAGIVLAHSFGEFLASLTDLV